MEEIMGLGLREVTYLAVLVRILTAAIIGGLIGLERGMKNRPAGLRTYMLVCTGSCLIMLTNQYIYQTFQTGDPTRMAAQVISGIGFLGAGTIVVTRRNQIKGLTTAAGLWSAAGVGLALGIGFYEAALIGSFAIFTVMTLLQKMDSRVHSNTKNLEIYVELNPECPLGDFLRAIRDKEIEVKSIQQEHEVETYDGIRAYIANLKLKTRHKHIEVLDDIRTISGVVYLEKL
jgi:putative Mg2+ transporter-C (MgtC) family protein